jgi:hypothetical protein
MTRADLLKREGAAAERQAVVELLVDIEGRCQSWVLLNLVREIVRRVRNRRLPPNSGALWPLDDACAECGGGRAKATNWLCCTTCDPDQVLAICPGCIPVHELEHAARGDVPPEGPAPEMALTVDEGSPEVERLEGALVEFEEKVDKAVRCLGCDVALTAHIGQRCLACWRRAGCPAGDVDVVEGGGP